MEWRDVKTVHTLGHIEGPVRLVLSHASKDVLEHARPFTHHSMGQPADAIRRRPDTAVAKLLLYISVFANPPI